MDVVVLRTERCELSPPTDADVDAIFEACQDPAIQRYTTVPSPYLREHAEQFIPRVERHWAEGREATWGIRHDGRLAGMIGLYRREPDAAELGFWMAPWARRQHLLTEAATAVVDFGFESAGMSLVRIEWRAVVGNTGSARTARALGFRYEGTLRQALAGPLQRDDAWIAGLLPGDDRTPVAWPVLDRGLPPIPTP